MTARILAPTDENLLLAADALRGGDLVAMPTETVYGLAALACDESALAKIFDAKERPRFNPLIVHLAMPSDAANTEAFAWVDFLAEQQLIDPAPLGPLARASVEKLAGAFWPGPLTLVLPKHARVPDLATAGMPTVALRVPRHPAAQRLLRLTGEPLAAPSANRFGRISPTSARDVFDELADQIELSLDGGPCEVGLESTVVAVEPCGTLRLLRPGGVAREAIEALLGRALEAPEPPQAGGLASPGMLASHYAPRKRLVLLPKAVLELTAAERDELACMLQSAARAGVLLMAGDPEQATRHLQALLRGTGCDARFQVHALSRTGDLAAIARNLFLSLRTLDVADDVQIILSEPVNSTAGLGHAIADRLQRASNS